MDMKNRTTCLEEEIAQFDEENHMSQINLFGHTCYKFFCDLPQNCVLTHLESSDASCVLLANNRDQKERLNAEKVL